MSSKANGASSNIQRRQLNQHPGEFIDVIILMQKIGSNASAKILMVAIKKHEYPFEL